MPRVKTTVFAAGCTIALILILSSIQVSSAIPKKNILGLRLNMTKAEAQKRLHEIGTLVREERPRQEVWKVRDKSFSHLLLGFDSKDQLRYVTAVAREDKDARRIPYRQIGNLQEASQTGNPEIKNFSYQWNLRATEPDPEMLVIARGRDSEFLTTYSLKRVGGAGAEEDD